MRIKKIPEACLWLPGFAPEDDPLFMASAVRAPTVSAEVIPFPGVNERVEPMTIGHAEPVLKSVWPMLTAEAIGHWGGKVTKFEANVAAIKLLRELEAEDRAPSVDERLVLQHYTGWGGLPAAFNPQQSDTDWASRAVELQQLLNPVEWESARASTPNAHYTDLNVVDAIWKAVEHFGFKGGRIVEPSCGVGHFIGAMPTAIAEKSTVVAVELDDLSGRITRKLYGQYGVQTLIQGYEKTQLPAGYFDLAISNVPFGSYKVAEVRHKAYADWSIHNYFFGKSLELVRAGGLIAFITSTSTMDQSWRDDQSAIRKHLDLHAEFLGAIRLPSGAFAKIADTTVTTDIIFLKKRVVKMKAPAPWTQVGKATPAMRQDQMLFKEMPINQYYVDNPHMMIGKLDWISNGHERVPGVKFDGDSFDAALLDAVFHLPENVYKAKTAVIKMVKEPVRVPSPEFVKPGAYVIEQGRVMVSEGTMLRDVHDDIQATARARIEGLCEIRDAARRVLAAQLQSDDNDKLKVYQVALNASYDVFVKRHGYISVRGNTLPFKGDPDLPLLLSLEVYDEESGTAEKADLFSKRTVRKPHVPVSADSEEEGLALSLQQLGKVEMSFIAALVGKREDQVVTELTERNAVFKNPTSGIWETANEYLSGLVREKLDIARIAGDEFGRNVKALEGVQPPDLKPEEIEARLGAPWIPASDVKDFVKEILGIDCSTLEFVPDSGTWNIEFNNWSAQQNVNCTTTWGTKRANAMELLTQALNQQVPTVRDKTDDDKYVVNSNETLAARDQQSRLKEKFKDWIWENDSRRERLARKYNDDFNSTVPRVFDGSHLNLPGFTQSITLRKHQLDAVWRILCSGNTLLAHCVGAGKTLTMVVAGMELRRLGLANKCLHVVPNHMLLQYTAEFLRAYPTAHVLMASKEDLQGDKRRELVSRIATGEWDAVIITHASFERIKMSTRYMQDFIREQLAEVEATYMAAQSDRGNKIVKELARAKKTWEARLEKLRNEFKKDDVLDFEELGVDQLFIDEAHLFKNLFRVSKMTRIAGLPNNNSERAFDMFVKTRYMMSLHNGQRGVVFATGTPISNSMAELHVMQRYLQPETLAKHLIGNFDSWAASFGEAVTSLEVTPDGGGYRMNTRFARFINLPELLNVFWEVADVKTKEMLNLPVPEIAGGKAQTLAVESNEQLKEYVATLVARAERIKNGMVKPAEDNMLKVTNDGRKAALDMRLIDETAEDDPGSKVNLCCDRVHEIWQRTAAFKGTQLVFCDLSTPSEDGRFSVYNDLKAKWIARGIPASEIEFIHHHETDAQKAKLFKAVREGKVRILMGSTPKLGIGTNVQTRLFALHHLDAPWRPSDVEQRDGRIERQGNTNAIIEIYRYVTRGSFDSYMWQNLEAKARFIAQVMCGTLGARAIEDVELAALSYAEVKALASGNPKVLLKAGIDAEIAKLTALKAVWRGNNWSIRSEISYLPTEIEKMQKRIDGLQKDEVLVTEFLRKSFAMQLGDKRYTTQETAGSAMMNLLMHNVKSGKKGGLHGIVGEIGGFKLGVSMSQYDEFPNFFIDGAVHEHHAPSRKSANGIMEVVMGVITTIPDRLANTEVQLVQKENRLAGLKTKVDIPFEHEARLEELLTQQHQIDIELGLYQDQAGAIDAEEAIAA